jgi:hypothetical protein
MRESLRLLINGAPGDIDVACAQTQKAPGRLAKGFGIKHSEKSPSVFFAASYVS